MKSDCDNPPEMPTSKTKNGYDPVPPPVEKNGGRAFPLQEPTHKWGRVFRNSFFAGKRMMIAERMAAKNEFLNTRTH